VTLDVLAKVWPFVFGAGGIAVAALLWRMRGEFATKADLVPLRADLGANTQRIERMERDMQHLPTKEDIHNLHIEVTKRRGSRRQSCHSVCLGRCRRWKARWPYPVQCS